MGGREKGHARQGHGRCDGNNISIRTLGIQGLGMAEQKHEDEGYYEDNQHSGRQHDSGSGHDIGLGHGVRDSGGQRPGRGT